MRFRNAQDAMSGAGGGRTRTPPSVRIAAVALVALVIAIMAEGGARLVFAFRHDLRNIGPVAGLLRSSLILDPYEMPSSRDSYHWMLRPGYESTVGRVVEAKRAAGKSLGAAAFARSAPAWTAFRINSDGFKGPELDPTHSRVRILSVGDSVTFGLGGIAYPRAMETRLNRDGRSVEVVNAGVEGYSHRNVLLEMSRYATLDAEIVTVYLGWNALFSESPDRITHWTDLRSVWLVDKAWQLFRLLVLDAGNYARTMYTRELKADRNAPDVAGLDDYEPGFMDGMERIVDAFERMGARVVLVTLPGLFTSSEMPSEKALTIGHLPAFTDNSFVFARMTERYNAALRAMAARRGLRLIDLEEWAVEALRPRDRYFLDSVHLTEIGLEMVGTYMGERLADLVAEIRLPRGRSAQPRLPRRLP